MDVEADLRVWPDTVGSYHGNIYSPRAGDDWTAYGLDGTDAAPYSIASNQLITWAGPYAGFRADNVSLDFKALSVREIAPL